MANKLWTVCIFILVVEMCERMTYYTFSGSQRNHLQTFGFSNSQSTSINAAFSVLTFISPIFGGWLADAWIGRFRTILVFACIYCVGVCIAAMSAHPNIDNKIMYLTSTMALITLGSGGIKPNIANFGGDQYDVSIPSEARQQEKFFSYFYLVINIGAGVSYGYLVTLATNGAPPTIPKDYGFFSAYMIATGAMFFALIMYLAGSGRYVKKTCTGDSLRGLIYYVKENAIKTRRGKLALFGWLMVITFLILAVVSAFITNKAVAKAMSFVSLAVAILACVSLVVAHMDNSFISEKIPDHPDDLLLPNEAAAALDTVPTLLVANVSFAICYNAINGSFQSQSCQMDLRVGDGQINGAFFNIADCFAIIVFVPLLENFLLPFIESRFGVRVSGKHRLVAGLLTSALAMIVATALEYARRNAPVLINEPDSNCAPAGVKMSEISGFWMFIPFCLVGLAEVLVNPFLYFFTYDQTPPRARSISQAFNLLCQGAISNGFTSSITTALSKFYTDDLNEGNIEYLYYLSAAGALVGIPLTLFVFNRFQPKAFNEGAESEDEGNEDMQKKMKDGGRTEDIELDEGRIDGMEDAGAQGKKELTEDAQIVKC